MSLWASQQAAERAPARVPRQHADTPVMVEVRRDQDIDTVLAWDSALGRGVVKKWAPEKHRVRAVWALTPGTLSETTLRQAHVQRGCPAATSSCRRSGWVPPAVVRVSGVLGNPLSAKRTVASGCSTLSRCSVAARRRSSGGRCSRGRRRRNRGRVLWRLSPWGLRRGKNNRGSSRWQCDVRVCALNCLDRAVQGAPGGLQLGHAPPR